MQKILVDIDVPGHGTITQYVNLPSTWGDMNSHQRNGFIEWIAESAKEHITVSDSLVDTDNA